MKMDFSDYAKRLLAGENVLKNFSNGMMGVTGKVTTPSDVSNVVDAVKRADFAKLHIGSPNSSGGHGLVVNDAVSKLYPEFAGRPFVTKEEVAAADARRAAEKAIAELLKSDDYEAMKKEYQELLARITAELLEEADNLLQLLVARAELARKDAIRDRMKKLDEAYNKFKAESDAKLNLYLNDATDAAIASAGLYGLWKVYQYLKNKKNKTPAEVQLMNDTKAKIAAKRANFAIFNPIDLVLTAFHGMTTADRRADAILNKYPTKEKLISKLTSLRSQVKDKSKLDKLDEYISDIKDCENTIEIRSILKEMMKSRYGLLTLSMIFNPIHGLVVLWKMITADDVDRLLSRLK